MKKYESSLFRHRRRTIFFAALLPTICAAFFLSIERGEMRAEREPVAQTPAAVVVISGRITPVGVNLSGVTVNLSGSTNAAATTDAAGNYQFSGLPDGGNFTVSPSLPNHFFTPPNRSYSNLSTNQTADFAAAEVCTTANCAKNGKIAFVVSFTNDIFIMNPDGSGQTNITNNGANNFEPDFSPDGAKIAFSTNRDGNAEIYRMNIDGSNPVRLTNNAASDIQPYYSPDGASILFVSNRDGNNEIYKMNADGSNPVRLTNEATADTYPAFSPDASKIIFVSARLGDQRLFTMNADGSNQQVLLNVAGIYERPSYSPDGSKVVMVRSHLPQVPEARSIWMMNADGTNLTQTTTARSLGPTWSPDGIKIAYQCCLTIIPPPDTFNGIYIRQADGSTETRITSGINHASPDWQPIAAPRRTASDFDGDGRSDISVFRPSSRIWHLLRSQAGYISYQWGLSDDKLTPGDYDGDLKTDIAVWRETDGNFYVLNSFNSTVRVENFGLAGDVPFAGDWDADGKADLSVYRGGAQGVFHYRASSGNPNGNITSISWGIPDDKPVANDYDGDGRTDAAIFRPSSGVWYVRKSSDGQLSANAFGLSNDTLVPADYDADGKTDLAVFRSGVWYLLRSLQGFAAFQYGISTDLPAPADYDGDGRAEAAVYRNGVWYVLKIQSGTTEITNFGLTDDKPIPAAYVR